MRRYRRGGGAGIRTIIVVIVLPLLIFAVDFGMRMTNGIVRTGGLDDGLYNIMKLGCAVLLGLIAAQPFWYWSRLASLVFGVIVGLSAIWYIGYLKAIYLCKIGIVCL